MNLYLLQQYQFINSLYRNDSYIDILCNIDEFFDLLGLYVYPNWFNKSPEIVDMKFYKYFTELVIRTKREDMPDPKGAQLLLKYGCKVEYRKTTDYQTKEVKDRNDLKWSVKLGRYVPKVEKENIWIVSILIPNKYIMTNNVYNIDSIQQKLDMDQDADISMSAGMNDINVGDME